LFDPVVISEEEEIPEAHHKVGREVFNICPMGNFLSDAFGLGAEVHRPFGIICAHAVQADDPRSNDGIRATIARIPSPVRISEYTERERIFAGCLRLEVASASIPVI
jgi:hypothetical protein